MVVRFVSVLGFEWGRGIESMGVYIVKRVGTHCWVPTAVKKRLLLECWGARPPLILLDPSFLSLRLFSSFSILLLKVLGEPRVIPLQSDLIS